MADERDDNEDEDYGEPAVTDGPGLPDPQITAWPQRESVVFIDTSTLVRSFRFPLQVLADRGRLHIFWSAYVAAEVARVATREQVFESLKQQRASRAELTYDLEARRHVIDEAIEGLERSWDSPAAPAMARLYVRGTVPRLADRKDQAVLTAALAVGAQFLLSADRPSFDHLKRYGPLTCWHPDTFLTAYFQSDRAAYVTVCQELEKLPQTRLLP
jgi:hypothetical protein